MNMNGINGYQVYQKQYTQNTAYGNSYEKKEMKKQEAGINEPKDIYEKSNVAEVKKETVTLSDNAKELLERLKEKYSNMDFTVASYSSTEEAQKYLSKGTKEYSVLIDPELLEQMAADEEVEKKYTNLLESATTQLADMKEQLGDNEAVARLGVAFGADGTTTYFSELEKMNEKQRERIEKLKEDKKEEKEAEKKKKAEGERENSPYEKNKRVRLYADSAGELLAKIQSIEWDKVKAEETAVKGSMIDFGV